MSAHPVRILLVEDDEDHAELFKLTFHDRQITHVTCVPDAIAALEASIESLPDLVLLDLKLPGHSGIMVLETVRADPRMARLPIAVLSTSRADRDRVDAAAAGADAYYEKPMGSDEFEALRDRIDAWWPEWVARAS